MEIVHGLIEERSEKIFVLTGSSARKLRRAGVNLLGGRAGRLSLHPYMAAELGDAFSLEKALKHGLLPVVIGASDPNFQMQAYCGLYLKEEIQAEGFVRNVGNFSRFLEVMSFSHGVVLNLSNVSRECAVKRATLEGYLSILEDLMLGGDCRFFPDAQIGNLRAIPNFIFLIQAFTVRTDHKAHWTSSWKLRALLSRDLSLKILRLGVIIVKEITHFIIGKQGRRWK